MLPGLPWRASFGRVSGPAPGLGADTDAVLRLLADGVPGDLPFVPPGSPVLEAAVAPGPS